MNARFDQELKPGDRWVQQLHSLIGGCFAFVILMTPESTESNFVSKEIHFAQETGRPVIPILIRDTQHLLLSDLQHIDGRANRDPVPELLDSLRSLDYAWGDAAEFALKELTAAGLTGVDRRAP